MTSASAAQTISGFIELPRRLFLDSSTLQTMMRYGEFIWENVEPTVDDRAYTMPGFMDDLDALRMMFQVNQRAAFDIVVSENSVSEVSAKGEGAYIAWALDVLDHWRGRVDDYSGSGVAVSGTGRQLAARLDGAEVGYLSIKDKLLLRDAVLLECDAFITMEKKLARNATHIQALVGLEVLRPPTYWKVLRPWAGLYL